MAIRLTEAATAPLDGRWWDGEIVMPAKDFELVGPNRAGDTWKMLLAFNHIPGFFQAAVWLGSSYFDSTGWPTMTLVENTPAVQVTMDELRGLKDGVAAARINRSQPDGETRLARRGGLRREPRRSEAAHRASRQAGKARSRAGADFGTTPQ